MLRRGSFQTHSTDHASDGPRAPALLLAEAGFHSCAKTDERSDEAAKRGGTRIEISADPSASSRDRTLTRSRKISKTCASMTASVKLERVRNPGKLFRIKSADQYDNLNLHTKRTDISSVCVQLDLYSIMMSYSSTIPKPMILATSGTSEPPAKKREFNWFIPHSLDLLPPTDIILALSHTFPRFVVPFESSRQPTRKSRVSCREVSVVFASCSWGIHWYVICYIYFLHESS
jgi:hypothetical protein